MTDHSEEREIRVGKIRSINSDSQKVLIDIFYEHEDPHNTTELQITTEDFLQSTPEVGDFVEIEITKQGGDGSLVYLAFVI